MKKRASNYFLYVRQKKLLYISVALVFPKKVLVCLKLIKFSKEQKDEKAQLQLILIITTSGTIEKLEFHVSFVP